VIVVPVSFIVLRSFDSDSLVLRSVRLFAALSVVHDFVEFD